ncbi:hypothetical protein CAEBREN_31753 [Caenorhabditis brenneri]|uniref:Uncharacterized protein n=1 Tax=Caenorhabditis brenneri TaxID=135651 RepID=G0PGY6_CAEBE|nr:hypothetical protein CAEBREN_31753 [Caenorhabditis brenneri]
MPPPTPSLSLLLLLLLLSVDPSTQAVESIPTHSVPLPSLYIPVGVGSTPDVTKLKDGFGVFGNYLATLPDATAEVKDEFTTCGSVNVKALNQNYLKTGDGNMEYSIFCEPSPDRVIVRADGQDFDFGQLPRDLKKECEVLTCSAEQYPAAGTQTGQMTIQSYHYKTTTDGKTRDGNAPGETKEVKDVPVHSAAPENPETNVCKDKKPGFSNGKTGSAMISNEGHCYDVYADLKKAIQEKKGQYMQIPRWLQPGEQVRNKRSAFFSGEVSVPARAYGALAARHLRFCQSI